MSFYQRLKENKVKRTGQCSGAFEGIDLGSGITVEDWTTTMMAGG